MRAVLQKIMSEEGRIFSIQCVKNLSDKVFEKRKQATIEIEKTTAELALKKDFKTIENIINYFENEFIMSINPTLRRSGLIGLASVTLGLYKEASNFTKSLMPPVIQACHDNDINVRLSAFESLYNMMKIIRSHCLIFFVEIFEIITKNCCDPDVKVRQFISHCDRLLKELLIESSEFQIDVVPTLCDKMFCDDPFIKQLTISWVATISKLSYINMTTILPSVLEGLFYILDDPNSDIRKECEFLFDDLLKVALKTTDEAHFVTMINILTKNCVHKSTKSLPTSATMVNGKVISELVATPNSAVYHPTNAERINSNISQSISLAWLRVFINVNVEIMIKMAGPIIGAVLPCLSYIENNDASYSSGDNSIVIMKLATGIHLNLLEKFKNHKSETMSMQDPFEIVSQLCTHPSVLTRLAALEWLQVLIEKHPDCIVSSMDVVLNIFMHLLFDSNPEVLDATLDMISGVLMSEKIERIPIKFEEYIEEIKRDLDRILTNENYNWITIKFIHDLYNYFMNNLDIVHRSDVIITYLCKDIPEEVIYAIFALVINRQEENINSNLIKSLNRILLIEPNLSGIRKRLYHLETDKDCALFVELYKAWSHNPISLLSLCLISQCYEHTCRLTKSFDQIFISCDLLLEMDELVRMIESPIFATLRVQLLNERNSLALQETLYCILMLLPQSEAFNLLQKRLLCLPKMSRGESIEKPKLDQPRDKIKFDMLLEYFKKSQNSVIQRMAALNVTKTSFDKKSNVKVVRKRNILTDKLLEMGIREKID